jgi:hypothetical protein
MGACCTALSPILTPPLNPLLSPSQVCAVTLAGPHLCGGNVGGLVPVPCGFAACTDFPPAFKARQDCFHQQQMKSQRAKSCRLFRDAAGRPPRFGFPTSYLISTRYPGDVLLMFFILKGLENERREDG